MYSQDLDEDSSMEVDKVVCEAPSNELDDEPLSKWIEGMHTPSVADGSSKLISVVIFFPDCTVCL